LLGKYVLDSFDDVAAALLQNRRENRRNTEHLRGLRQRDDVVDDKLRPVTVRVRKLESLMIDKEEDTLFGRE
jgi:hypothetical protein